MQCRPARHSSQLAFQTMNILHLTPYYAPAWAYGGVPRAVEGLARALQRRGHGVTVLTSDALAAGRRHPGPADDLCDGVRVLRVANALPWLRDRFNLSTTLPMGTLARDLLPAMDVVHCHELRTLENLLVTPRAQAAGLPLLLSPHGTLSHDTGRGRFKALWDRAAGPGLAQRFNHVIALTEAEVADLRALWSGDTPTSVIPNGIDPEEFADLGDGASFRETWQTGAGPLCLFMGRLHQRKGLQALVEAFRMTQRPDARLVIAGPDEGMRARLEPLQDGRLLFTGLLTGQERLDALAAAALLALPARGEGLPMAALEAMGAGLPLILAPGCNLPQAVTRGAALEVLPQRAPLAQALERLLADPSLRAEMGRQGRALVNECFTWERIAQRCESVYRSLLSG